MSVFRPLQDAERKLTRRGKVIGRPVRFEWLRSQYPEPVILQVPWGRAVDAGQGDRRPTNQVGNQVGGKRAA